MAAKKNVVTRQKRCPPDGRSRCPLHQAEREVYTILRTFHFSFGVRRRCLSSCAAFKALREELPENKKESVRCTLLGATVVYVYTGGL